jgi:hypothetical protein
MSKWKNAKSFVTLALSIDKHLPGYVDAYFGPPEIKESVEARGKILLQELSSNLDQIIESTHQDTTLTEARREYLSAELKAMQTTLRILNSEDLDIIEETRGLYGLTPTWTEERVFREAHQRLQDLLPGSGPLAERMEKFRGKTIVPNEKIESIVTSLADDFRKRTVEIITLPESENCKYSLVKDKPWGGYNWYLGKYASRVDVNTDLPIYAGFLPLLVSHEAYPGHHTEHAMKEKILYRDGGHLEHCILPSNTPNAVISEGIAENALEMIATPDEIIQIYQSITEQAGLKGVDGSQIYQILKARHQLRNVGVNRILLFHGKGAPDEEVVNYGIRYALFNEKRSRKTLEFYKDPLWRSYGFLYPMGYDLVHDYVNKGKDKIERFTRLLQKPFTTSQLVH